MPGVSVALFFVVLTAQELVAVAARSAPDTDATTHRVHGTTLRV
jgi:hypothetical protein